MPGCFSRSAAVPAARKVRMVVNFGTLASGAMTTVKPLLSFFSVIFGRFKGLAAPGGGGVFCWPLATVTTVMTRVASERVLTNFVLVILVASFGVGFLIFSLRHTVEGRAIF